MLKITLDETTRAILYNEDPYDNICRQEMEDFLEESKNIYLLALELNKKIKARDNKEMEKMVAEYPEEGENIFSIMMARIDLDYLFEKFPTDDEIPTKYASKINELQNIISSY